VSYVATQIVIWMLLAFLLGLAVGWFARGRRKSTNSARRRF
jgi:hypothetical protein